MSLSRLPLIGRLMIFILSMGSAPSQAGTLEILTRGANRMTAEFDEVYPDPTCGPPTDDGSENSAPEFCRNPFEAVCGKNDEKRYLEQKVIEHKLDLPTHQEARKRVASQRGLVWTEKRDLLAFLEKNPEQENGILKALDEERLRIARSHTEEATDLLHGVDFKKIREQLKSRIMDKLGKSTIPIADRERWKKQIEKKLNQVNWIPPAGFYDGRLESMGLMKNGIYQCGRTGMNPNAFAPPGSSTLFVCPGELVEAATFAESTGDDELILDRMEATLFHELGHFVDAEAAPGLPINDTLLNCYSRNMTEGLPGIPNPTEQSQKFREHYANEIIADHWHAEVLGEKLLAMHSRKRALETVVRQLQPLCHDSSKPSPSKAGENLHPPPRVRLDVIFGKNAAIRAALGCSALPNSKAGCH